LRSQSITRERARPRRRGRGNGVRARARASTQRAGDRTLTSTALRIPVPAQPGGQPRELDFWESNGFAFLGYSSAPSLTEARVRWPQHDQFASSRTAVTRPVPEPARCTIPARSDVFGWLSLTLSCPGCLNSATAAHDCIACSLTFNIRSTFETTCGLWLTRGNSGLKLPRF
jgi:hypothetical protein